METNKLTISQILRAQAPVMSETQARRTLATIGRVTVKGAK